MTEKNTNEKDKKKRKEKKEDINFLDYIPVKDIEWAQDEDGKVYLIKEKTKSKIIKKIIDWVNKSQNFHIRLDDHGTAAWLAIDGKRTVYDIAQEMKKKFGEEFSQAEERLAFFVGNLSKNHFVKLFEKTTPGETSSTEPKPETKS